MSKRGTRYKSIAARYFAFGRADDTNKIKEQLSSYKRVLIEVPRIMKKQEEQSQQDYLEKLAQVFESMVWKGKIAYLAGFRSSTWSLPRFKQLKELIGVSASEHHVCAFQQPGERHSAMIIVYSTLQHADDVCQCGELEHMKNRRKS